MLHENKKSLFVAIGFVLSLLFLFLAMRKLEWNQVVSSLENANLIPWIAFSVGSYLFGHILRGIRTHLLVSKDASVGIWTTTQVVVLGYAVNNILPARMGEFARAGMLTERTGITYTQSLTITFLERLLDGVVMVALLALAALFVGADGFVKESIFFATLVFGAASVAVLVLLVAPGLVTSMISRTLQVIRPSWHDPAIRYLMSIINGVSYLKSPVQALLALFLSLLVWLCEGGLFLFMLPVFGLELNYLNAILVMSLTNLGIMIPSAPGFIGAFHFFCMQGLLLVGANQATAISFATLVHLAFYIPITLWGVVIMLWYGIELGSIVKLSQKAKPLKNLEQFDQISNERLGTSSVTTVLDTPSLFTTKLAEAICPFDRIPSEKREELLNNVASFLQGQINSIPRRYIVLFTIGMTGFRTFSWMRYGRPFCALSVERRTRWVNAWAYGPIGLTRQLFRLVRATSLLAFYEASETLATLDSDSKGKPVLSSTYEVGQ